jgi:hypothetical protein
MYTKCIGAYIDCQGDVVDIKTALMLTLLLLLLLLILMICWSPCSSEGLRGQRLHHCTYPLVPLLEYIGGCGSTGHDHSRTLRPTLHWTR